MNKTSIIVVAYDTLAIQRQITSTCLGNIERYTDDYELILIDQGSVGELNTRYNYFKIDKHIKTEHIGMSAAMNLGYKESNPDYPYICFMHNDVFVWEGWLPTLRSFIEESPDTIIMPHQGPTNRETIKRFQQEENPRGNDDAGLVMMSKETFKKTGGWDERFKAIYQDSAFRMRFPVKYRCTGKCVITHIGAVTVYADAEREKQDYRNEVSPFNALRGDKEALKKNYL